MEFENLPEGWILATIDSICQRISSGGTPSRNKPEYYVNGNIRWLKTQELLDCNIYDTDEKITEEALKNSSAKLFPSGTVVIAMYGATVGRLGILKNEISTNQACCGMVVDETKASSQYLYFVLKYTRSSLVNLANGAAQQNLNIGLIKNFQVPLPPLPQQQKIASILGALDDKIELNNQMNQTLETMAKALFKSWFVDFEPFADGEFEESELGMIPKGWKVSSFFDTVEIIGGGTPKTSVPEYWDGDIPWYSVVDAPTDSDVYVIETEKQISSSALANSSAKLIRENTTIISARGTVGKLALAGQPMTFNQSCYALQHTSGDYYGYFSTKQVVEALKQNSHGSVFSTITKDTFKSVKVIVPSDEDIIAFEKRVAAIMRRIKSNLAENKILKAQRDTLLPKLMSGEIELNSIEVS